MKRSANYSAKTKIVSSIRKKYAHYRHIKNAYFQKQYARGKEQDNDYKNILKLAKYLKTIMKTPGQKSKSHRLVQASLIVRKLSAVRADFIRKSIAVFYKIRSFCTDRFVSAESTNDVQSKFSKLTGESCHRSTLSLFYVDHCVPRPSIMIAGENKIFATGDDTIEYPISSVCADECLGEGIEEPGSNQDRHSKTGITWTCNDLCGWGCKDKTREAIEKLEEFYGSFIDSTPTRIHGLCKTVDQCVFPSNSEKGHPISCWERLNHNTFKNVSGCPSKLLFLKVLGSHFSKIRTLVTNIYKLKRYHQAESNISAAFNSSSAAVYDEYLRLKKDNVIGESKKDDICRPSINEETIVNSFRQAIKEYEKVLLNLPTTPTICCKLLKPRSQCSDIKLIRKFPNSTIFSEILRDNNVSLESAKKDTHFTCRLCMKYFSKNEMPPQCYKNNLSVPTNRGSIIDLNYLELLLVKRAHPFQIITMPHTASGKRIPSNQAQRKARGTSIHLPIPIVETLKTVLSDNEVIRTCNLHIAVRSAIGNKSIVWQDFVRIDKVYENLKKLKYEISRYPTTRYVAGVQSFVF